MNRLVPVVALVLLAGCSGITGPGSTPTGTPTPGTAATDGYVVATSVVDAPPDGATVTDYGSDGLDGASYLKALVEETVAEGGIWRSIGEEEFETLESELSDVPRYDGGEFGYYVEYRGTVVRLRTLVRD